jgi:hypothetical protein
VPPSAFPNVLSAGLLPVEHVVEDVPAGKGKSSQTKRHDREPCPGDGVTAFGWVPSAVVSEIQYLPTARVAARRSDDAHPYLVLISGGTAATVVINIDLVRVVGW